METEVVVKVVGTEVV
jgi:hypothetical protein